MKKILAGAALCVMFATPAFASDSLDPCGCGGGVSQTNNATLNITSSMGGDVGVSQLNLVKKSSVEVEGGGSATQTNNLNAGISASKGGSAYVSQENVVYKSKIEVEGKKRGSYK